MIVKVLSGGNTRELECEKGENLLALLQRNGYHITARCGGRGSCGKCKVKVLQGAFENQREDFVLSCLATVGNDCAVEVFETEGGGLTYARAALSAADGEEGFGVALDIGTTTMAFSLVDLKTGAEIETSGVLNSQGAYGADVISRIVSANEGNAAALQRCVLDQTRDMLHTFMQKYSLATLKRLAVCGNTTMLHLFLQKSVKGIGQYPFIAEFLDIVRLSGAELSLSVEEIVLLPSVAAYLGADIVAGGLAANLSAGNDLLVDIGTNGEMLLHVDGKYLSTSTAAGPCFEGANIECGTGGVSGAIDSVCRKDGKLEYTTIGGAPAVGICGAGLVDAIALMLRENVIDGTGAFTGDEERFYLSENVYISQKDVRNFQLAKSAIYAGIRVLLQRAGLDFEKVDRLYIAGGLGFYLDRDNAVEVGLLPEELKDKIEVIGNSALAGTKVCLCGAKNLERAQELARGAEYIDLSADAAFMDEYISNMNFGESDAYDD